MKLTLPVNKNKFDVAKTLLLWLEFGGDNFKTARTLGIKPEDVEALATQEGWLERLSDLSPLAGGRHDRLSAAQALSAVQTKRLMNLVDMQLEWAEADPDAEPDQEKSKEITMRKLYALNNLHKLILSADTTQKMLVRAVSGGNGGKPPPQRVNPAAVVEITEF